MKTHLLAAAAFVVVTGVAVSAPPALAQHRSQHQECRDVETKQINSSDDHRVAGTAIGAVAGGLLGNQVGHGRGGVLPRRTGGANAAPGLGAGGTRQAQNAKLSPRA